MRAPTKNTLFRDLPIRLALRLMRLPAHQHIHTIVTLFRDLPIRLALGLMRLPARLLAFCAAIQWRNRTHTTPQVR